MSSPVTNDDASLARYSTGPTISAGSATRLISVPLAIISLNPGAFRSAPATISLSNGPGDSTLTRMFRRETGQSFSAWRQRVRLLEALARLGAGESVTNVALDVGYDSPSAFTAMFRRELGAAPRRYLRWADTEVVLR